MMYMMTALIGAALLASPSGANKDAGTLTGYGLLGSKWAVNCSKPMSESNSYLSYGAGPNGTPMQTLRRSSGDKVREMRNVQAISPGWFLYTLIDENGKTIDILTKKMGDRTKSWWSVGEGGKAYILNGKGEAVDPPWFQRCR